MKKSLLAALGVIVVLYPATVGLLGYSIEHRADEFVQRFNESNPYVKISVNKFRRGWFVSEQDLTLDAARPGFGAGAVHLVVHNVIHHGPICGVSCLGLARIDSHLIFPPELQPYVTSVFGSAEPVSIQSRLGLFGGGSAQISSAPIADATALEGHFSSDGINVNSDYSSNFDSYSVQASAPRLAYTGKDGKRFEVSAISAQIRSKRALRSLYASDSSIAVGQMSFGNSTASGAFKANDFKIASHVAIADGFMTGSVNYGVASLSAPPLTLTDVNLNLTFRHLEAESMEHLTASIREINRDTTLSAQARMAKMMDAIKAPAIALLAKHPEISIDRITASTAGGSATISGLIKFQGVAAGDFESAGAKALIKKIDADLEVSVDEAFLTGLPGGAASVGRLKPLISQGLATEEGGKFHTTIGFHGGQTSFNGKAFGPPVADQK